MPKRKPTTQAQQMIRLLTRVEAAFHRYANHLVTENDWCQKADRNIPDEQCRCTCGLSAVIDSVKDALRSLAQEDAG